MKNLSTRVIMLAAASMALSRVGLAGPTSYTVIDLTPASVTDAQTFAIDGALQAGVGLVGGNGHALIWSGSAGSFVDINGGFTSSVINAVGTAQEVGTASGSSTGNAEHAILWTGNAASAVDLNPAGYTSSYGMAANGGAQGGYAVVPVSGGFRSHATLWTGTAASAVDLHPTGYSESAIYAIGGGQQGGYASDISTSNRHAVLWTGTAASAIDLNPTGFTGSQIFGVGGGMQAGEAIGSSIANRMHAMLWSGTAAGVIDLHPAGFLDSSALAIGDGEEVGYAASPTVGVGTDAMVWTGTAASAIDLKQFLPVQYGFSKATGIDSNGDIVGYAIDALQNFHAIEWIPVPEPTSLALLGLSAIPLLARRRR